jgi:tetratricopeptide (TPR) repeat protein
MLRMMEDHRDAYFFWKELGIRGAPCLHVDAHLDMAYMQTPLDFNVHMPELNCANYLLRAVEEGIVSRVVWVIPPDLPRGHKDLLRWTIHELGGWLPLTLDEHNSLQLVGHRVEGTLRGVPFTVCTTQHLPALDATWLLDLDVDYFFDHEDRVFQTPFQLHELLPGPFQATTIAYSVLGGYTPLPRRYLGDLAELLWSNQTQEARRYADLLHGTESLDSASPRLQAAALVTRAWGMGEDHAGPAWDKAAAMDPAYKVDPFEIASMYWLRKKFDRCRQWLEPVDEVRALYLRGFMEYEQKHYSEAADAWSRLQQNLHGKEVDAVSKCHLLSLTGKSWMLAHKDALAINALTEASELQPRRPEVWRDLARAHKQAGNKDEAIRCLKKAIQLAPTHVSSVEAQIELAELYVQTQQPLLAQGQYRKLQKLTLPGNLRVQTESLPVKISLASSPARR